MLDGVQDLPEVERKAYLDLACAGDPAFRQAVERLLELELELPERFLAASALEDAAGAFAPGESLSGRQASGYRVLELLGSGGMGDVYLAEDERLGRRVALKVLPSAFANDAGWIRRVEREAKAVSSLNHPNILTLYGILDFEGSPCLVLELVDGETLRDRVLRERLSPNEAIDVAIQIAAALSAAHRAGFVHRDLKPENVMLRRDGLVKVLDFGLAKPVSSDPVAGQAISRSTAGQIAGTAGYMSPEQMLGLDLDGRSDLYSFGVMLNEAVAARPASLASIIERLLRPDREERYASADELASDLKALQGRLGLPPGSDSGTQERSAGGRRRLIVGGLPVLAALVVTALVIGFVTLRRGVSGNRLPAGGRHSILLGEFANATGEPLFDWTLAQALTVYLEQSPYLGVFPEEGVRQTLRYMQRPPGELPTRLPREVAREVCQRNGIQALVGGRIASLGSRYVITLEAALPESGENLARSLVEAESKDQVLMALQRGAAELRSQLGESLSSIREFDRPLEQATTASLEALRDFALARQEMGMGRHALAVPLLQRAIERDPSFASAYAHLALAFRSQGNNVLDSRNAEKAYQLRDRVSEREALFITQQYESFVLGDLDRAVSTLRRWRLAYPRDHGPSTTLAATLFMLGRYDDGIAESRASLELSPDDAAAHTNLGIGLAILGRAEEAQQVLTRAEERGLAMAYLSYSLGARFWLGVDESARRQKIESVAGTPGEASALNRGAAWASELGQRSRALDLSRRAIELSRTIDPGLAGRYGFEAALRDAAYGYCDQVDEMSRLTLDLTDHAWAVSGAAVAQALCGRDETVRRQIEALSRRHPRNTLIQRAALPTTNALLAMNGKRFEEALASLERAASYERGTYAAYWPAFARGLVLARAGRHREAVEEFQRVIDNEGLRIGHTFAPSGSMARLHLARAATAVGDPARARRTYEELLARWSQADLDLGLRVAALAELEALRQPAE